MRHFALAAAAFCALVWAASAFAHAEPAKARPGDGALLTSPPARIELEMSQELARREGANGIDVFDASGKEVTAAEAIIDNADRRRISVELPATLPPGKYSVRWKTLSAEDGDTAEGALSFTYDPTGVASPGKETLREDLLGLGDLPGTPDSPVLTTGRSDGVTWVLVVAVGLGMFTLGSGGTFLLVQKRR